RATCPRGGGLCPRVATRALRTGARRRAAGNRSVAAVGGNRTRGCHQCAVGAETGSAAADHRVELVRISVGGLRSLVPRTPRPTKRRSEIEDQRRRTFHTGFRRFRPCPSKNVTT